jgi:hypothetical protein
MALRLCVEIFRVLSGDQGKLSALTIIQYVNQTELMPLTVSQLMELFDIYQPHNLEDPEITKQSKELYLLFRTYELLDFIKKFLRQIENAIT